MVSHLVANAFEKKLIDPAAAGSGCCPAAEAALNNLGHLDCDRALRIDCTSRIGTVRALLIGVPMAIVAWPGQEGVTAAVLQAAIG